MAFLSITEINNDAQVIKILHELKSALRAGNLSTGLSGSFNKKIDEVVEEFSLGLDPKGSIVNPNDYIQSVLSQAGRLNEKQLYAGLALMCKDIVIDDNKDHRKGTDLGLIIEKALMEEESSSPFMQPEPIYKTSGNMIKKGWYVGALDSMLFDNGIIHEWTVGPGQKLFEKFKEKFKDVICKGPDSPYEKMEKDLLGQADLPTTIVAAILASGMALTSFWIPILVYIALLLVKTGIKTYCEN